VQVAEGFLIGADEEDAEHVLFAFLDLGSCSGRLGLMPWEWANLSILPSLSQVMSESTALRVGFSLRRWIGMTGKIWSMAQRSGRLWKTLKFP
jgi:hypothetical protein